MQPSDSSERLKTEVSLKNDVLLMFSGGRDSTIAAMRLHARKEKITLVTVSSSHLIGINRVKQRLRELSSKLPPETPWLHIQQPTELQTDTSFYEKTCLPCHHAYVVVSGFLAHKMGIRRLAFGYAGYQTDWPEQTPLATARLAEVLRRHNILLELPVYDLITKEGAIDELKLHGLIDTALEQKCLRQVSNIALSDELLFEQIAFWEDAIDASFEKINKITINVIDQKILGDFM